MATIDSFPDSLEMDVWLKQPANRARVPDDAELACLHDIGLGIVEVIPEALFFRRHEGCDELWCAGLEHEALGQPRAMQIATALRQGRIAWSDSQGTPSQSAAVFFTALTYARVNRVSHEKWREGSLIDQITYSRVSNELQAELERNRLEAEAQSKAPIIVLALRLGLSPEPSGTSPSAWYANCPGGGHRLMISSSANQFSCMRCRVSGHTADLEAMASRIRQR